MTSQIAPVAATKAVREIRKFPRVQLPLQVEFDGDTYQILDCSANGIGVVGVPTKLVVGDISKLKIYLPASEGKVRLDVKGQLIWMDRLSGRSGWRFVEIHPDQRKLIAELTLFYSSGQLQKTEGQLLKMTSEASTVKIGGSSAAASLPSPLSGLRRLMGLGLFAILGVFAAIFLFKLVYAKLFLVEASSASIFSDVTNVASPFEGTLIDVQSIGPVKLNQVIAKISQPSGTASEILSPCDCEVVSVTDRNGSYVGLGQVVAVLVRSDAKPTVSVRIPFQELERVVKGATVSLTYLDGRAVSAAKVIGFPKVSNEASAIVTVFVEAGLELKPSQVGEPVYAQINVAPW